METAKKGDEPNNYKKETIELIDALDNLKLDRRTIERELGLSEGYLDQQVSKGSNKRLVASLRMLLKLKNLEKATPAGDTLSDIPLMYHNLEYALKTINSNVVENLEVSRQNSLVSQAVLASQVQLQSGSAKEFEDRMKKTVDFALEYYRKFYENSQGNKQVSVKKTKI